MAAIPSPFGGGGGIAIQAATPAAGVAHANGAVTFVSWAVPNDGKLHEAVIVGAQNVTVNQTGGGTTANWTPPSGNAQTASLNGTSHSTGDYVFGTEGGLHVMCQAGSTVSVTQTSNQTLGAATVWAVILGS